MKDWMKAVEAHHALVKSMADEHNDYQVIWTSLIGSQNYNLESENSDCDTFSVVLPNYFDFISNTNLISFETEVNDGKCVVKDFRLMMNLLRKTSPNSVEVFASKYKIFEPAYEDVEKAFFNSDTMFYLTHANYKHMLNAIAGMAHQLHGRNMTDGKRYSHALRLEDTEQRFLHDMPYLGNNLLFFLSSYNCNVAREAKFDTTDTNSFLYKNKIELITAHLMDVVNNFNITPEQKSIEYTANHTINRLQFEVTKIYLKQNNFMYKE